MESETEPNGFAVLVEGTEVDDADFDGDDDELGAKDEGTIDGDEDATRVDAFTDEDNAVDTGEDELAAGDEDGDAGDDELAALAGEEGGDRVEGFCSSDEPLSLDSLLLLLSTAIRTNPPNFPLGPLPAPPICCFELLFIAHGPQCLPPPFPFGPNPPKFKMILTESITTSLQKFAILCK